MTWSLANAFALANASLLPRETSDLRRSATPCSGSAVPALKFGVFGRKLTCSDLFVPLQPNRKKGGKKFS
jgi:hypothetical protein